MGGETRYNIVFHGELVSGADPEQVRRNLAQLFKMELERVEQLFAGKPVTLKKEADQATAMKMRAALKKAGAECEMKALDEDGSPEAPPGQAPASGATAAPSATDRPSEAGKRSDDAQAAAPAASGAGVSMEDKPETLETVGTIRTGGTGFSSEFEVAPPGADMEEAQTREEQVDPDISHLSLAPPGTDLEQLQTEQAVEVPDISHLKVQDPDEGG
jgi:hypothetical protein